MNGSNTSQNDPTDQRTTTGATSDQRNTPLQPGNEHDFSTGNPPLETGTLQSTNDRQGSSSEENPSEVRDMRDLQAQNEAGSPLQETPAVMFLPDTTFNPTVSSRADMHDLLGEVTESNAYKSEAEENATASTPIEGASKSASHLSRFESGSWISFQSRQSHESYVLPLEKASEKAQASSAEAQPAQSVQSRAVDAAQSVTELDFPNSSLSQAKWRPGDAEPAPNPHAVRSTTIPSQVVPQPSLPEQVFSEPTPFGQTPPPQRCESRSCAMRRSAYNALACNMLDDPTPSPPALGFPTEPVLIEMNSGEQTSSVQSEDYFLNESHWTEASTLPATTTPSGQSNSDLFTCLESSDASSSEKRKTKSAPEGTQLPAEELPSEQLPAETYSVERQDKVKGDSGNKPSSDLRSHSKSDEELLVLISSAIQGNSGSDEQSEKPPLREPEGLRKQNSSLDPTNNQNDVKQSNVEIKPRREGITNNTSSRMSSDTKQKGTQVNRTNELEEEHSHELPPGPNQEPTSDEHTPVGQTTSGESQPDHTRYDENENNQNK